MPGTHFSLSMVHQRRKKRQLPLRLLLQNTGLSVCLSVCRVCFLWDHLSEFVILERKKECPKKRRFLCSIVCAVLLRRKEERAPDHQRSIRFFPHIATGVRAKLGTQTMISSAQNNNKNPHSTRPPASPPERTRKQLPVCWHSWHMCRRSSGRTVRRHVRRRRGDNSTNPDRAGSAGYGFGALFWFSFPPLPAAGSRRRCVCCWWCGSKGETPAFLLPEGSSGGGRGKGTYLGFDSIFFAPSFLSSIHALAGRRCLGVVEPLFFFFLIPRVRESLSAR